MTPEELKDLQLNWKEDSFIKDYKCLKTSFKNYV